MEFPIAFFLLGFSHDVLGSSLFFTKDVITVVIKDDGSDEVFHCSVLPP